MAKDETKKEEPKPEPKVEPKKEAKSEKKIVWSQNKPNPKTVPELEISDPKEAKRTESITTILSEKHTWSGGKPRVEKPLFKRK